MQLAELQEDKTVWSGSEGSQESPRLTAGAEGFDFLFPIANCKTTFITQNHISIKPFRQFKRRKQRQISRRVTISRDFLQTIFSRFRGVPDETTVNSAFKLNFNTAHCSGISAHFLIFQIVFLWVYALSRSGIALNERCSCLLAAAYCASPLPIETQLTFSAKQHCLDWNDNFDLYPGRRPSNYAIYDTRGTGAVIFAFLSFRCSLVCLQLCQATTGEALCLLMCVSSHFACYAELATV